MMRPWLVNPRLVPTVQCCHLTLVQMPPITKASLQIYLVEHAVTAESTVATKRYWQRLTTPLRRHLEVVEVRYVVPLRHNQFPLAIIAIGVSMLIVYLLRLPLLRFNRHYRNQLVEMSSINPFRWPCDRASSCLMLLIQSPISSGSVIHYATDKHPAILLNAFLLISRHVFSIVCAREQ